MNFNKEKFKDLLLYITERCGAMPNVGKVVLFKILYFCDFDYYELSEEFLTGASYRKIPLGPAPCEFDLIIQELKKEKKIRVFRTSYYGCPQEKYLPLSNPNLKSFTADEIKFIDVEIDRLSHMNASQIKEYSHKDIPCEATQKGEILNYELVFYRTPEYSVREYDKV